MLGIKQENNKDSIPVFAEFTFYFREDTEKYKNNNQDKKSHEFECPEESKKSDERENAEEWECSADVTFNLGPE